MGELIMFLGVMSIGLIAVNVPIAMVVSAVLMTVGGNMCAESRS